MTATIDVYREWLKIEDPARPVNYYKLLHLEKFEDDTEKIRKHYRKLNGHVRKYATGKFAKESQELLNELARAMLCLTDAKRKREYDKKQGRQDKQVADKPKTLEELLLARGTPADAIAKAKKYATAVGVDLRDAVVQQKVGTPDEIYPLFAQSIGLSFVDLEEVGLDEHLLPKVPALLARQNSCAPVMVDEDQLLVASPNPLRPEVEDELRMRIGMPVRSVLCTPAAITKVLDQHYTREQAQAEKMGGTGQPVAAGAAVPKAEVEQLTAEERAIRAGNRLKVALVAGCFTTAGYSLVFIPVPDFMQYMFALLLGAIGAGVGYVAMVAMNK